MWQTAERRAAITFLITGLARGGAEAMVADLATWLHERGWPVGVVSMLPPGHHAGQLSRRGIAVASLEMQRKVPDPRAVFRLRAILRQWQTRLLHCHMVHANLLGRVTRLIAPVPVVVCTAHSVNEGGGWRHLAYRLTDPLCDLTTQVSQAGADRYLRLRAVRGDKIRVIPNSVDVRRYRPDSSLGESVRASLRLGAQFAWLAAGRLEAPKDYPGLVRAFAEVRKRRPAAVLLIAGEGSCRAQVETLVADLGLTGAVCLLGLRDDMPGLMNAVDAYVMSSVLEGLPLALLEASATGLPIVATDVGGSREVVRDGQTGFLVPAGDPAALAEAMVRLADLPEARRREMGAAGRAHVEAHHAFNQVAARWEDLYRELLAGKGGGGGDGSFGQSGGSQLA